MSKLTAAYASVIITIASPSATTFSQTVLEPDHYTKWLLTIPADTKVRLDSKFGVYDVPIGYLNSRLSFRQNPFAAANNVARHDAHLPIKSTGFAFDYWVPDGGMVWHQEPQVRENRPIEPGHMSRSRENFVVNMHSMNSLDTRITRKPNMSSLPSALDVVLPARPIFPDGVAYEGATRDGDKDDYLRFYIECRKTAPLCEGWFVIDRRQMVLWIFVPRDAADLMFNAVKTAARLLDSWDETTAPPN